MCKAVEPKTPIGVKLVFSRYLDQKNEAFYTVSLVCLPMAAFLPFV